MTTIAPISVVIPCFNCVGTLERAIQSVAGQTVLPEELILVDDGSGAETKSLMKFLQCKFEPGWIKLVKLNSNSGAASARNAGWEQAKGTFVAFLDADDAWHPRKIEFQFKFMASQPSVVVSGHGHRQVESGFSAGMDIADVIFEDVSLTYVLTKNPFITPSFMVRRSLDIRFLPGRRYMEDHLFLMQVSAAGYKIAKSKTPLGYIFKPIFGESGLSADLLRMQLAEIGNYNFIQKVVGFSPGLAIILKAYSWIKFCRRVVIVNIRNLIRTLFSN